MQVVPGEFLQRNGCGKGSRRTVCGSFVPVPGLCREASGEAVTEQHRSFCKAKRTDFPLWWLHSDPWAWIGVSAARAGGASLSHMKLQC